MPSTPALRALREELRRNPRLQAGGLVIVLLILGWLFLVAGDWRNEKIETLKQTQQRLLQVRELARQQSWVERADEAGRLAEAMAAELPPAASPGLAQADFQGWLRGLVDSQGGTLRLEVQPPVRADNPADVIRVTATVSGSLSPVQVAQLVNRIESRATLATIPVMTVRSDGANQTFSLTVQGFYRLAAGEARP